MLKYESPQSGLNEAETKAHQMLSKDKKPMDIKRLFGEQYGEENINKDLRYVAALKTKFLKEDSPAEKEAKKLAELFEMLLSRLVELQNWLGEDAFIMETSEFDDFRAGIDMVVEILKEGAFSHLGLAIDVTFSPRQIEAKLERIRNEIDYYGLPRVKYFVSERGDFKGELSNIPRVVVSVDRKTISDLVSLWLDTDFLRKRFLQLKRGEQTKQSGSRLREAQNSLAEHPLQIEILAQIEIQLEKFADYASRRGKTEIDEKFRNILAKIKTIREDKKDIENNPRTKVWPMLSLHHLKDSLNWLFS